MNEHPRPTGFDCVDNLDLECLVPKEFDSTLSRLEKKKQVCRVLSSFNFEIGYVLHRRNSNGELIYSIMRIHLNQFVDAEKRASHPFGFSELVLDRLNQEEICSIINGSFVLSDKMNFLRSELWMEDYDAIYLLAYETEQGMNGGLTPVARNRIKEIFLNNI